VTIVVEDGTGLPGANAYIDGTYVTGYFNEQRLTRWNNLTQPQQDTAIVGATQFIDLSYKWIGKKKKVEQGLNWPRVEANYPGSDTPIDGVPEQVKKATAEAVWLLMEQGDTSGSLFTMIEDAQVKSEAIGALKQEFYEKKTSGSEESTRYDILNLLLAGLYGAKTSNGTGVVIADVERV
jgi:hypothetical protein